jgi:peptidoglycan/xylan/chitin deacetylase (PgdA/CDA1 family)
MNLKYAIIDLPFQAASAVVRHLTPGEGPLVVNYHSVSSTFMRGMPPEIFDLQMSTLRRYYTPVSLDQIVGYARGGTRLGERAVAVTFDDGFRDNYLNALPILAKYGIPFTVFVTTSYINSIVKSYPARYGSPEGLLASEIRELAELPLAIIGSHTISHRYAPALDEEELRSEIGTSMQILQDLTGRAIKYFAFPGNFCSIQAREILKDCGYLGAVCGELDFVSTPCDPYHIARIGVSRSLDNSPAFFRGRLEGGFRLLKLLKRFTSVDGLPQHPLSKVN